MFCGHWEELGKSNLFWKVLHTNPQWKDVVQKFNQQWSNYLKEWSATGRAELQNISLRSDAAPTGHNGVLNTILSAVSVLKHRQKTSMVPSLQRKFDV